MVCSHEEDHRRLDTQCSFVQDTIVEEWEELAETLGEDDMFIFYFSGHGVQIPDQDWMDEEDGKDEVMLFVKPDGSPEFFVDDQVADLLAKMDPACRVVLITDCCHSGTMGDLSKAKLRGRPIFHIAATLDHQEAVDLLDGGALTTCIIETVKKACRTADDYSITEIYNDMIGMYQDRFLSDQQNFSFSFPHGADPDTCPWPFMPPPNWNAITKFDGQLTFKKPFGKGPTQIHVPGMQRIKTVRQKIRDGEVKEELRKGTIFRK